VTGIRASPDRLASGNDYSQGMSDA
jgi:hypothetical protein